MFARPHSTVWGVRFIFLCFTLAVFLVVGLLSTAVVVALTGQPIFQTADTALELLSRLSLPVAVLISGATWFRASRASGAVLLDCGPNPARYFLRFLAALGIILSFAPAILFSTLGFIDFYALNQIIFSSLIVAVSSGRLQIRQNGLWIMIWPYSLA